MTTRWIAGALLGLCLMAGCAKKPSEAECRQAVDHLVTVLDTEVIEQFKRNVAQTGSPLAPGMTDEKMREAFRQREGSPEWERVKNAHIAACQAQPQTRVTCVTNVKTTDELVRTCGMKPSQGGPRGGFTISWPD